MTPGAFALMVVTGAATGVIGYATGIGTLVAFPVLLAAGLSPIAATVATSVSLAGGTVGALTTSRPELASVRHYAVRLTFIGLVGGALGSGLLLLLPAALFERVVPYLIAFGSLTLLVGPWLRRAHRGRVHDAHPAFLLAVGASAVYCGYSGSGAGVLVMATMAAVLDNSLAELAALRTLVLGTANLTSGVIFVFTDHVHWGILFPLALGTMLGSAAAPALVRRAPQTGLRFAVAAGGLCVAIVLALGWGR